MNKEYKIKELPKIGLGTWGINGPKSVEAAIKTAYQSGYQHIDTAQGYNNEKQIGDAFKSLNIPREDFWITTKVFATNTGDNVEKSFNQSLRRLDMDYVDLTLLHFPLFDLETSIDQYKRLIKLRESGKTRHIGISNFTFLIEFNVETFKKFIEGIGEIPKYMWVANPPTHENVELFEYAKSIGIEVVGFSTLKPYFGALQQFAPLSAMTDDQKAYIDELQAKYNKNVGQILNRWSLDRGYSIIPKSTNPERIAQNIDINDFELTEEEVNKISSFNNFDKTQLPEEVRKNIITQVVGGDYEAALKAGVLYEDNFDLPFNKNEETNKDFK